MNKLLLKVIKKKIQCVLSTKSTFSSWFLLKKKQKCKKKTINTHSIRSQLYNVYSLFAKTNYLFLTSVRSWYMPTFNLQFTVWNLYFDRKNAYSIHSIWNLIYSNSNGVQKSRESIVWHFQVCWLCKFTECISVRWEAHTVTLSFYLQIVSHGMEECENKNVYLFAQNR